MKSLKVAHPFFTRHRLAHRRQQLHQAPRVRIRNHRRIELRLLPDQRRHQVRIEIVLRRLRLDRVPPRLRKQNAPIHQRNRLDRSCRRLRQRPLQRSHGAKRLAVRRVNLRLGQRAPRSKNPDRPQSPARCTRSILRSPAAAPAPGAGYRPENYPPALAAPSAEIDPVAATTLPACCPVKPAAPATSAHKSSAGMRERWRDSLPPPAPERGPASRKAAPANRVRPPSPLLRDRAVICSSKKPRRLRIKSLPVAKPTRPPMSRRGVLAAREMRSQVPVVLHRRRIVLLQQVHVPAGKQRLRQPWTRRKPVLHLRHNPLLIGGVIPIPRQFHQQIEPPRPVLIGRIRADLAPAPESAASASSRMPPQPLQSCFARWRSAQASAAMRDIVQPLRCIRPPL